MADCPWFYFFPSDWLGSNKRAVMSLEQQGAYVNLLARQWSEPTCSLPDDDEVLAALSEMGEGWLKGGSQLVRKCFPPHPTLRARIANPKLLELRAERDEWVEKSREGGRKSAAARKKGQKKGGSTTVPTTTPTKRQPKGNSPSPSPSPSSTPTKEVPGGTSGSSASENVQKVIAHYQTHHPKSRPGDADRKRIGSRLKERYSVLDLCAAIDGCHRSPHHCGETETNKTKYQSLELIMRDSKHVQQFMEVPLKPQGPGSRPPPERLE